MVQNSSYHYIIDKLYSLYKERGFLSEEEALRIMSTENISLVEINKITNKLFAMGVLFSLDNNLDENYYIDYGFIDYNNIYKEVISIDKNLKHLIHFIKQIKPPQKKEFDNLYLQAISGNNFARRRIIEMNMRQAVRQALYFSKKYFYPLDECMQDALLGLVLGLEKYDTSKSQKFPIHITWWIRQNLYRYIKLGNYLFNFPSHLKQSLFKVNYLFKKKHIDYLLLNKNNLTKKIGYILSCNEDKAYLIFNCFIDYYNIDNFVLSSDNNEFEYNLINSISNSIINLFINNILLTLPLREQDIIKKRYGINKEEPLTLEIIGEQLFLTRERIRQIEVKAIRRLRHSKRSKKLLKLFEFSVNQPTDESLPKNEKYLD